MGASANEYVVGPPGPVPMVTLFRSQWITSSVETLKKRSLYDAYLAQLSIEDQRAIAAASASSWIETPVVVHHYEACDRLALSTDAIVAMGRDVTDRVHATALTLGRNVATASGLTPWTMLERFDKLWVRLAVGGGVAVARLGPKEARIEIHGFPIARIRYNRIGARGIVHALTELFCRAVWTHEVGTLCTATTLGYRIQWA